ncbi:MAG: tetratricopeptide repeat protein [Devosia sp.]
MAENPDREGVNRALARLLNWPEIARSPQLARFLSYIVERQLAGEGQSIKAYSIAVDVFGRPSDFDPQADPIVRVQARRLRSLLDQYYRGPGADDDIQIQLPIGRYVPEFVAAETTDSSRAATEGTDTSPSEVAGPGDLTQVTKAPAPRGHVTVSWFVLLVLAIGAAALVYSFSTVETRREQTIVASGALQPPRLRVMEFQNLTGDSSITPTISALAIELVTDFEPLLIVDVSLGSRAGGGNTEDFSLTGIVRDDPLSPQNYQVGAILTELATNSIVWNWSISVPRDQLTRRGGVDAISQELILLLGGTRGPLHDRARELLSQGSIAGRENFYLCGVLFSMYRTSGSVGLAERVRSCIAGLPESERDNGNVIAGLASLIAEGVGEGANALLTLDDRLAEADELMDRAVLSDPTSSFVWEQRARLDEMLGLHDIAEAAYGTALQINPSNMDAMAAHARHLALIGRLEAAIPAARRAMESVPQTQIPDWYFCVPSMAALYDAEYRRALSYAERCARSDRELGSILALLAAQGTGDASLVDQQLPRVLEVPAFRQAGILSRMRERATDLALIERIETGLREAGVPETSLNSRY